jgi:hypothetical protein
MTIAAANGVRPPIAAIPKMLSGRKNSHGHSVQGQASRLCRVTRISDQPAAKLRLLSYMGRVVRGWGLCG